METPSKPPRFKFTRQQIGVMEVVSDVLDGATISGVSGTGASLWLGSETLTLLLTIATLFFQLLKRGLASLLARCIATDPIVGQ